MARKPKTNEADDAQIDEGPEAAATSRPRFAPPYEVSLIEGFVDLPLDELEAKLTETENHPLTDQQVAGLLEVEKSGKNRHDVVQLLMARLGIDNPAEATPAGPNYENVVTRHESRP